MAAKAPKQKERSFSIGYFAGLDVLRFISATGVIFHHVSQIFADKGLIPSAMQAHTFTGSFFLSMFFVISGFLICSILIKEKENGLYNLRNFYLRRIIRIWPLYFLVALIFIVIIPSLKHAPADLIKTNAAYAFGFAVNFQLMFQETVKTYSILWSVCVEEHIYLVLPLLIFIFKGSFRSLTIFMLIAGLASLFYFSHLHERGGPSPYYNSLCYLYYFGLGSLLAVYHGKVLSSTFLFGKLAQVLMMIVTGVYVFHFFPEKAYVFPTWIVLSGSLTAYWVAAASRNDFILKVRSPVSRYLGNVSYAMYLVHVFVISLVVGMLVKKQLHPSNAQVLLWFPLLATALAMILSTVLYFLYERPFLKLKNRFTAIKNK